MTLNTNIAVLALCAAASSSMANLTLRTKILVAVVAGFVTLAGITQAGAEEKLVPGKDRINVPAIGDGLCLHNLFQSGMVLQAARWCRSTIVLSSPLVAEPV